MIHTSGRFVRASAGAALLLLVLACAPSGGASAAQAGGGGMAQGLLKQKLTAIKASAADNQKKLHGYAWTETSSITANGREMPPRVSDCHYGPDGKVVKVAVGGGRETGTQGRHGGRLMQRIMDNKKAEMKDYMTQVGHVIQLYIPPNQQKLQQAFEAHKVSFNRAGGDADLVFKDYALKGDQLTIEFDTGSRRIRAIHVNSYLDTPQDAVNLTVDFATLPDGTNHPSRTTLDAQGKGIHVVNVNSNYRKTGQS